MRLIIQTCIEPFEIALVINNKVEKEVVSFPIASTLFPAIKKLLTKTNCSKKDIAEIGFVAGPGSFSGLRSGFAFAKALSRSLKIPLKGVGVFDIFEGYSDCLIAYKRTKRDAFVSIVKNGKVNFNKSPIPFIDIKKLLASYEKKDNYGNVFDWSKMQNLDILEINKVINKKPIEKFELIYGESCYAKPLCEKNIS